MWVLFFSPSLETAFCHAGSVVVRSCRLCQEVAVLELCSLDKCLRQVPTCVYAQRVWCVGARHGAGSEDLVLQHNQSSAYLRQDGVEYKRLFL